MKNGLHIDVTVVLPFYPTDDVKNGVRDDIFPTGKKYQTLWLLHGGNGNDQDYINYTNVVRYATDHMLAVVMPTGYNMNTEDFEPGMKMCKYLGEELPDVMRSIFPLSDKPEDNFIGGLSMGSIGSQKIAVRYPENYSAVLAMSGGLFFEMPADVRKAASSMTGMPMPPHKPDEVSENMALLEECLKAGKKMPKFFMIWGDNDIARWGQSATVKYLEERGLDVWSEEVPGYSHEWDLWDLTLRKAFNELLPLKHDLVD